MLVLPPDESTAASDRALPDRALPHQALPDQVLPDQAAPNRTGRDGAEPAAARRAPRARKRLIVAVLASLALVLVACAAWVGVRALLAKGELEAAVPLATSVIDAIGDGDTAAATATADDLRGHTAAAAGLTSDPVWRAAEVLPLVGDDLRAVRDVAGSVHSLATDAIVPLLGIADEIGVEQFTPVDGKIPVEPLVDAQPAVSHAAAATAAALARVESIDTSGTIDAVTDAVDRLEALVGTAATATDAADRALRLLPLVLGADGPRDYLLMFQNPAEARSSGGIPSALALIHTEDGAVSLTKQASSGDFPRLTSPALDVPDDTEALYGDITGRYIQNTTLSPHFPLSGSLAREMWAQRFGVEVDGVISLDPVTLGYILEATGPVTLPTGDEISSDNAVDLLLRDVYARFPEPSVQDAFFAGTAATVFETVSSGDVDPLGLLEALARGGQERRVLVWSAQEDEQAILAGTTLTGDLTDRAATGRYGVYLNDAAGSKMASYLDVAVESGAAACGTPAQRYEDVTVTLTNTAPTDAATSLPAYVTGGGAYGVRPGDARYLVGFYGAAESQLVGIESEDASVTTQRGEDFGLPVGITTVDLAPGESITLRARFLVSDGAANAGDAVVDVTPGVREATVTRAELECDFPEN